MPVGINQPSNQIRLTNVAVVRLKKGKKRFEIACYKNKVLEYRSGVETDLDEVLQVDQVFTNVSKGALAPKADLQKSFGPKVTQQEIILEILQKGELQVGEKERSAKLEQIHNEVISIVASKCVDPGTKRVYTASMIDKALNELSSKQKDASEGKDVPGTAAKEDGEPKEAKENQKPVWRGVTDKKSAKAQALEAIKALVAHQVIPIARARMRLRILGNKKCKEKIMESVEEVEEEDFGNGGEWECVGFVEPGRYKALVDIVASETKGRGRVEVLDTAVIHEGDS